MKGIFQDFELTFGSFGEQHTTIDGTSYLTWLDLSDPNLKGLRPGAIVEYEVRSGPTVLCEAPRVQSEMESARLIRVISPRVEAA